MTVFAGAITLQDGQPLPEALLNGLRRHVSRTAADHRLEMHGDGFFAVKVDIGAFGAPGMARDKDGSVTAIAGEPLVRQGEHVHGWDRGNDVDVLHPSLAAGDVRGLRSCRGTFCGLHFNPRLRSLTLFVDHSGVRPVYLWSGPRFAVFSTALRVLEALPEVPKQFDLAGVTEIAAFGLPLADRTPYLAVSALRAGELVRIEGGHVTRTFHSRWDGALDAGTPYLQTVANAHAAFMGAIARRQRGKAAAAAFLSGGLDSRAIVGALKASGSTVHSVNYAPDGSQDQVFAALIAKQLGVSHTQLETNAENVGQGYRKQAVSQWLASTFKSEGQPPPAIWSGDGGSVALGHVYITPKLNEAMRRGDTKAALADFSAGVPLGVIRRRMRATVAALPLQGVQEELAAISSPDGARAFHLFLMMNDQRRHLARHFEDIDLERIEFQLPFFDADFLASILRLPIEPMMFHHFYMDWLARFPNGLDTTPWQSYPGHVPCPEASLHGLKYQWTGYYDKAMYAQMRRATIREGWRMLIDAGLPTQLLSRGALLGAVTMTACGIGDYSYLIKTASTFNRYWKLSTYTRTSSAIG